MININGTDLLIMAKNNDGHELSLIEAAAHRLLLPVLFLTFGALYFMNTYQKIPLRALRYPYFVLLFLVLVSLAIAIEEILFLYGNRSRFSNNKFHFLLESLKRWDKSIFIILYSAMFIFLIDIVGFVISMFIYLIGGMRIAGLDDWRAIFLYSTLASIVVYSLFVIFIGIQFPTGPFGI